MDTSKINHLPSKLTPVSINHFTKNCNLPPPIKGNTPQPCLYSTPDLKQDSPLFQFWLDWREITHRQSIKNFRPTNYLSPLEVQCLTKRYKCHDYHQNLTRLGIFGRASRVINWVIILSRPVRKCWTEYRTGSYDN